MAGDPMNIIVSESAAREATEAVLGTWVGRYVMVSTTEQTLYGEITGTSFNRLHLMLEDNGNLVAVRFQDIEEVVYL
jgi:hypothetical protein